jgi:hypothetical protein
MGEVWFGLPESVALSRRVIKNERFSLMKKLNADDADETDIR